MAGVRFNPSSGPQVSVGGGAAPVNVGVQVVGGGGSQTTDPGYKYYQQGMDANFGGNLPQFLEGLFEPQLQAARQERIYKGFADGVAGITAEEIHENKPWYSKVFGPTDYDSGVIMYDTQKQVSELAMSWQARMPELREKTHEQVTELLVSEMTALRGNNPFANALLDKGMMESFAPLIQQHTKERVAWQQTNLVRSQVEAADSRNTYFQQMQVQAATLGDQAPMEASFAESLAYAEKSLMDVYQTGDFQSDEAKKTFLNTAAASAMRKGQFFVIEALRRNGFMDALPADEAEAFEKKYVTAQAQYRTRFSTENPEFLEMIAKTEARVSRGVGGKPIVEDMENINRTYRALTGSPMPYYDADQIASAAGRSTSAWLRKEERLEDKRFALEQRAMDAAEKEALEARNAAQLTDWFVKGSAGAAINLKHVEAADMDRQSTAVFTGFLERGDVQGGVDLLVRNFNNLKGSYKNNMLSEQLRTNLTNSMDEQITDGFMQQYGMWKAMHDTTGFDAEGNRVDNAQGQATAIEYYSSPINQKMREFDRKLQLMTPDRAYVTTFGEWVTSGRPDFRGIANGDQKKNAEAFLSTMEKIDNGQSGGWIARTFGDGMALHPSARIQFAQAVSPYVDQLGSEGMLPEHRMMAAANLAISAGGIEFAGGQMLRHGRNQQPLSKFINDTDGKRTSVLFHKVLTEKAKKASSSIDIDSSSVVINRLKDDNGVPVYVVHVQEDDGFVDFDIRGTDLLDAEDKITQQIDVVNEIRRQNREGTSAGTIVRTDSGIPLGVRIPENVPLTPDDYRRIREMEARRKANK